MQPSVQHEESPKEKRRKRFIEQKGLPKAVDRGQFATTYHPYDGHSFQALSGLPPNLQNFTVLGIESSCDDTGAAVVRSDGTILGEALASQSHIHAPWGGVVPGLAKEAHEAEIDRIVQEALEAAGMTSAADVDAIGVTVGPGLEICLRVGATKARALAVEHEKPFVGVHHLEAHILMARLPYDSASKQLGFPFLALLVSGGHCQLLKCTGIGNMTVLGGTFDDSLGEAYDKTARLLGLPVGGGGGPVVERLAREGDPTAIPLSVPLQSRKDLDFSYSGLKSNVRRVAERLAKEGGVETPANLPHPIKANLAASFQHVAIQHVEQRLRRAMILLEEEEEEGIRSLALVGGVAANQVLRTRIEGLCKQRSWDLWIPPPRLCTDQGTMSAWAAIERIRVQSTDDPTIPDVYARYPFAQPFS
ncbi:N6-L-threonylcarbamoyladenine synthase [Fistulifera solaris]|uniref:N(6)-L-threonylcarbamoyladenine synthase n=1 Tax=Fistulifera solaris TaxID=1519565 RepID=A0A1Z5J5Q9_FISSO|nr:N6-L-threonylcarbamoyladenine synthase [Fistulifera solaris]|eukprot:GAX09337.1 N6-L-threonylcarbamoyladenine synthase [Fistulifera solaris]